MVVVAYLLPMYVDLMFKPDGRCKARYTPIERKSLTRSENVDTLAVVGEVRAYVTHGRRTDSDSVLSCGRGVVASIPIIVT